MADPEGESSRAELTVLIPAKNEAATVGDIVNRALVHAADVEGRCEGIDEKLVELLGCWGKRPVTYAGGARSLEDLARIETLSNGNVDLTIGSALDIFGGTLIRYGDCVAFNRTKTSDFE